jgi:predicted nucleic acid-binding Zn ribbon protein
MTWWPLRGEGSDRDPRPIGESLDATARRLGSPGVGTLGVIFAHWEELVGPEVARHAKPYRLRAGVLVIEVDQPAWATQLRFLSGELLEKVGDVTGPGGIREVQIRVSAGSAGHRGDPGAPRRRPDTPLW